MSSEREMNWWNWLYKRWPKIAYRTRNVALAVLMKEGSPWVARGQGLDLRFERWIDADPSNWPHDREVIRVEFDALGRLKGCSRSKVIQIERGRSHADLCRMLGIKEPR